ncbi:MAG: tetratricopeptide repeat protein [Deltaproteobacteria bacterium]|nr:tetratricopeptide repeat protein [Deltaproteobacteria bacterium]
MDHAKDRSVPDQMRGGYSEEEVSSIYELGRIYLENGNLKAAEAIMQGLTEVVPDFSPAWLGLCYIQVFSNNYDAALLAARRAHTADPASPEALLFLISCLLSSGDYHAAGTYLGEIGEKIEGGGITDPEIVRFFRAQLARYQAR